MSGRKSLFVVLGPSGSGKSSFLRAGLIPRLQREDRRFVVLGIMRPERDALTGDYGLAVAIDEGREHLAARRAGDLKTAGRPRQVYELLVELRAAAAQGAAAEPLTEIRTAAAARRLRRAPARRARHPRWCCRWIRPRICFPPTPARRPSGS